MRWLGLDIGASRVGVAICDENEAVVTALATMPFAGADDLARRVAALAAGRGCRGVVLGVPRTRGGTSRGEQRVAAVAAALGQYPELVVALVDETGTTSEAQARLAEAGVPRRRWPGQVDGVAASIILEAWLEARRRRTARDVDLDGREC